MPSTMPRVLAFTGEVQLLRQRLDEMELAIKIGRAKTISGMTSLGKCDSWMVPLGISLEYWTGKGLGVSGVLRGLICFVLFTGMVRCWCTCGPCCKSCSMSGGLFTILSVLHCDLSSRSSATIGIAHLTHLNLV